LTKRFMVHVDPDCLIDGPGVVAVSGGADSVALLRLLADRAPLVAHLNHQWRGAESDGDEQFVRELAGSLSLRFVSRSIDLRGEAKTGESLEATARRVRYAWLEREALQAGAGWIATGHTADDQAETVLHRLIRGTGIQGLRGIARERTLPSGARVVRPLLQTTRDEIVAWLKALPQAWREDSSNRDPAFTRNRIRQELLPLLRTFNPAIATTLNRLAEQAAAAHQETEARIDEILSKAERPRAGANGVLDAGALARCSDADLRSLFRRLWDREGWPLREMTFEHWQRLVRVARNQEPATDLPGSIRARRRVNTLTLGPA
jgi:tRNA(Ile)-lysidine synthase